ncbi:MAG: hypothetical protein WDM90_07215 [Ferruginibacter sp.]
MNVPAESTSVSVIRVLCATVCGVEVTEKKVRRERMGHIKLGGACCAYLVL